MREKPIPFSTPMVQAILDGRKTMTRRVVGEDKRGEWTAFNDVRKNSEYGASVPCYLNREISIDDKSRNIMYPKYDVGDILWVRETWQCVKYDSMDGDLSYGVEFKDGTRKYFQFDDNERFHQFGKFAFKEGWQPSIYLPKEAARIWLEVVSVAVERVQEITEEDAKAEGFEDSWDLTNNRLFCTAKENFEGLWNTLNLKRGYGWDVNPWVFVIEFKRVNHE